MIDPQRRGPALLFALAALLLMLSFLWVPPVQRTQEARVLETAREMMHAEWRGWLIPKLNGQMRLEKPPLAYWLAAVAFRIAGVSEAVGRVPFALVGWATVMLTLGVASRVFDRTTGFLSAAALLGFLMFARHARLAETDILATFFVTAAIWCIWRGTSVSLLFSGVMAGCAVLGKGLPALFALVFLLGLAAARWRTDRRLLWRWVRSGAPLLLALIALPWFAYVHATVGLGKIKDEAQIGMTGQEHVGSFVQYFPDLLRAVLPWTGMTVLAIVLAARRWRMDEVLRELLLWFVAIFVPLLLAGQRQFHYLLPAMPPLAILTGWCVARGAGERLSRAVLIWTTLIAMAASVTMPLFAHHMRGHFTLFDAVFASSIVLGCVVVLMLPRAFPIFAAVAMTIFVQTWLPTLRTVSPREVAQQIRAIGPGPYYFYGKETISVPVIWYMREVMPTVESGEALSREAAENPSLLVIAQSKSGYTPPALAAPFTPCAQIKTVDQTFTIYRVTSTPRD